MEKINKNRRNFLRLAFYGVGVLVVGKVLGMAYTRYMDGPSTEKEFSSFKTIENKRGITIYDKGGEEIFIMDNGKD